MEGTRSGRDRGRSSRQPLTEEGTRVQMPKPNPEIGVDSNALVAAAIQQGEDKALEWFQKFSPPQFIGGPNPDVAEKWLEKMIDIFAALHYTEERQVIFVVFQLEGAARSWWNMIRMKWEREQTPRTWVNFMREFNAKYFPPLIQEQKEDEFIKLRQGAQTVVEYESHITRLSKFAPELIVTEQRRIQRFTQGLNVEIQKDLAVAQINTFSDAVKKALRVENLRLQVRTFQVKKRGWPGSSSRQENERELEE
nr:uncharacterized protein LOC113714080 [Coffea arabica]